MSKIKNGGLDQYGAEPFEQQQIGTTGVEGVKINCNTVLQIADTLSLHCTDYAFWHYTVLHAAMTATPTHSHLHALLAAMLQNDFYIRTNQ